MRMNILSGNKKRAIEMFLVLTLIAAFTAISLASVSRFSTWHDESYSATLIEGSYSDIVRRTALDVHPPFYYMVLKAWSQIFGSSILSLRLMSVLLMAGAIAVAWVLIRRQYGAKLGIYALAGMAAGPFLIRYSQEVRMYALGALLAMSATYILWRLYNDGLNKRKTQLLSITYVLLMSAALYTHYFLGFLLAAHAYFVLKPLITNFWNPFSYLRAFRKLQIKWWVCFASPILLFLIWLPVALGQFSEVHGSFWIGHIKVETLTSSVINFFLFRQQWELSGWAAVFGIFLLTSAGALLYSWYRMPGDSHRTHDAKRLSASLLIVPTLLLIAVSLPPMQPAYQDRYLSFYGPILYGSFALCMVQWYRTKKGFIGRLPIVVMSLAIISGIFFASTLGNNQGWRPEPHFTINEMAEYIDRVNPDAQVVSTSLWTFLDAHVTIGKATQTRLYSPDEINKYGNGSVVYDREELLVRNLHSLGSESVWILEESGRPTLEVPQNWHRVDTYQEGYARLVLYKIN